MIRHSQLLFAIILVTGLSALVDAQSGRRKPPQPQPPIPIATRIPVAEPSITPSKVTSLIVTGEIIHDSRYFKSSYMDRTIKEFITWMKSHPRPFFAMTKGDDEMKLAAAIELAKKQTDVHVIWIGMVTKNTQLGEMQLDHVEYSILAPASARVVTAGSFRPGQQRVVGQGGVMSIPKMPARRFLLGDMRQAAREVVFRLKSTGWF